METNITRVGGLVGLIHLVYSNLIPWLHSPTISFHSISVQVTITSILKFDSLVIMMQLLYGV